MAYRGAIRLFSAAARQLVQQFSQRANQLASEQRAIDAEKRVFQLQFQKITEDARKAAKAGQRTPLDLARTRDGLTRLPPCEVAARIRLLRPEKGTVKPLTPRVLAGYVGGRQPDDLVNRA